jgi:protein-S-isoprenylcysteine O-methyltransferase Ste14
MLPAEPEDRPSRIPWPPILFAAALAGGWLMRHIWPLPWPGLDDWPARIIGYGFGVFGIALSTWALLSLARAHTNIMPHRAADRLVTTGPYRIWRHPLYMSEALMLLGLAQLTGNVWYAITALLFVLALRTLAVEPEERHLEARFGAEYAAYHARTRRWF